MTTVQNICLLQLYEILYIIFCLMAFCPLPSAHNVTFISDMNSIGGEKKEDHLVMREGRWLLFVLYDNGVSLH